LPLRCIDQNGKSIHACDLPSAVWDDVAERNRKDRHLRLPCCSAKITLRRSSRGTQFFAHKAVGTCVTAPETEVHLRLKKIAAEAARARGWEAETEIADVSPSGERWQADVLARKNGLRVAIEIQWSSQTIEETLRRQERYRQSGVRCLWVLRKKAFRSPGPGRCAFASSLPGQDWRHREARPRRDTLPVTCPLYRDRLPRAERTLVLGTRPGRQPRLLQSSCVQLIAGD